MAISEKHSEQVTYSLLPYSYIQKSFHSILSKRNVGSYLRINGCVHHDVPIFTSKNLGKKISHYVG